MKNILVTLALAIASPICFAQQSAPKAKVDLIINGRGYNDHIILRYAPTSPILFELANRSGYIVERADFLPGISQEKLNFLPVKGSPFKRWNDNLWKKGIDTEILRDSVAASLTALAMAYSDRDSTSVTGDILKNGLISLKEHKNSADLRFGFSLIAANRSKVAAEGLAVSVSDPDVKPGQTYVYRIYISKPIKNPEIEIAYVKVTCENFNDNYLRNDKTVQINEGDGTIAFSFPEAPDYYAFTAERSDDNGNSYKKIIKNPVLNFKPRGFEGKSLFAFRDTGLINYKSYRYRIRVATIYADELLLSEFSAMPKDKTPPPAPFLKSAIHIKPKQVELKWEMTGKVADDLKGFNVKRGGAENGNYSLISAGVLSKTTLSFIDQGFDPEGANYYIVEAVDTAGNISKSFPAYVTLIDSIPPATPVISSAKIDSTGKITLKIKPAAERDFMGYQLLKANSREHEFSVVLETFKDTLGRTTFEMIDSTTLNSLTKNIYYKVIAFDTHFNQSPPSKIIELTKKDTIPPVAPLITSFAVNDTSVIIRFANSSSLDVIRNILLRREVGKVKYDTLYSNEDPRVSQYTDKNILGGRQYEYAMAARDDDGLYSRLSKAIFIRTLLNNKLPAPVLQGSYDDKTRQIALYIIADKKLEGQKLTLEIYKRDNQKSIWIVYKLLDYEKGRPFLDERSGDQLKISYMVRLADKNKNISNFSRELQLMF